MGSWSFLTNHARVLLCIAHDQGVRLRDLATIVGVTERNTHGIVADLVAAGYVLKDKDGRRNRYRIQEHLPLGDPISQDRTVGELLDLLGGVHTHTATATTTKTGSTMADKSPHNSSGKKPGRTLKEKRAAKKLKRANGSSPFQNVDRTRR